MFCVCLFALYKQFISFASIAEDMQMIVYKFTVYGEFCAAIVYISLLCCLLDIGVYWAC